METLPSGTVTFLFTDIEGSTKLAQEHPDELPAPLARYHKILHQSILAQKRDVDKDLAAIHSQLDDATFAKLWENDIMLSLEQATALALEE